MLESEEEHHRGSRSHTRSKSSVSIMLGQLFSKGSSFLPLGASPTSSRPPTSLESVQEDIHTRNLLFPDAEALYQHQHDQVFPLGSSTVPLLTSSSNAFDLNPEVDLDLKDVRVVVMQEATSTQNSAALFDSHPLAEPPQSPATGAQSRGAGSGRSITSPRRTSLGQPSKPVVITQESAPRPFGAFDRRPSAHTRAPSYAETDGQRSAREYREEMTTFSNCIFGSSDIMAYKGTGTKVHIIPTESKSLSYSFDGHGSLGRSSMRSSKLAQSYTSENIMSPASAGLPGSGSGIRTVDKRKVLITRIFPVPLPNTEVDDVNSSTPTQTGMSGSGGYPFPDLDGRGPAKKPKQKRTPMYAIGLIVQLPATTQMPSSAPTSRSGFRPGSFNDQESYPSSYSSLKPSGWTVLGGFESLDSSYSDVDDRIDAITQHWDVIMRTLSRLQAVVSESVLNLLKQADAASPSPIKHNGNAPMKVPSASVSISGKRVEENFKPHKLAGTNAKLVQLMPHSLAHNHQIKSEIDAARQRIVSGIKAQQVVTRQGRWGIWREEARWVVKWAGGKEQAFFFYNLLTGFLGAHTEWLQALGPTAYRRHYYQQQRSSKDEDVPISARTIIVAQDKMAARRLLFLLSAFLPPNQQHQAPLTRMHRPSTSTSYGGAAYSQSPPSYVPTILREESLRRKVNKRNVPGRGGHSRTHSNTQPGFDPNERRGSDVSGLKTANLPIPGSDGGNGGTGKSGAATTTTVTPATTIPHFSTRRPVRGTGPVLRPGSSGSVATDDLIRSLKRGESSGQFSNTSSEQGYSRWGSVISTLWGNKRRGSTNETDITVPDLPVERKPSVDDNKNGRGRLADMVQEAQKAGIVKVNSSSDKKRTTSISYSIPALPRGPSSPAQEQSTPQPAPYSSPTKSAVVGVGVDGFIDIDVPLPPFLSFGSSFSSPSSSGYLSASGMGVNTGLEGFEHYTGPETEGTMNVAGWLPRYHPDFALQAIPSQSHEQGGNTDSLEDDIKASMKAEPTPLIGEWNDGEESRWVTVSTALIADATNWTIKRLILRRKVTVKNNGAGVVPLTPDTQSIYGNPYESAGSKEDPGLRVLEEEFLTDACVCVDEGLVGAVEKVVAWPETPRASSDIPESSACSRGTSRDRERQREGSDSTAVPIHASTSSVNSNGNGNGTSSVNSHGTKDTISVRPQSLNLSLQVPEAQMEVPRGEVKGLLLGALEDVAREVAECLGHERELDSEVVEHEHEKESFLREGVRGWLVGVEGW